MTIDRYSNLPAIVSELQDGAFQITVNNTEPSVLILGTAEKGSSDVPVLANKAQEAELRFGKKGTLLRGLFESAAGGSRNSYVMRIGAKSAILYGVGSDDLASNPTSVETILKDASAADLYFLKYTPPVAGEYYGRLVVKLANPDDLTQPGDVVYDNNPGGDKIDLGHVAVSGEFIGAVAVNNFSTMRTVAGAGGLVNLRDGADGVSLSKMELYEALDKAYSLIETQEFKFLVPMGATLDAPNVVDGAVIVLSNAVGIPTNQRYPVPGSKGDVLGKVFVEEFEGEKFYFWAQDGAPSASIWPAVGLASANTKINGDGLSADDCKEVNFAYQLANACFVSSANEYSVTGVIGTSLPDSFSLKDVSKWIGKEPTLDFDGNIVADGSGLLGNKFMAGSHSSEAGFFATDVGFLPVGGVASGSVLKDRGGKAVDIGRHISVYCHPQTFFNPTDSVGYGYTANGAAYYAGFCSSLQVQSAPTNKVAPNADTLVKLPKAKLDSLAKFHYIALKQKNRVFRFSDAPTAARPDSDYKRLSTIRVLDKVIDIVREIAQPYIGEPNTFASRLSLETSIKSALAMEQKLNVIQRFDVKLTATAQQRIEGNATIELVIVPPFEMKKIEVVTSLAKE